MNDIMIEENGIKYYKDHYCACPDHERIPWNKCHKWNGIPKFIKFHHRKGIRQSPEEITKRVLKNKGKKRTIEQRKTMRQSHLGINLSKEHCDAISKGNKISQNRIETKLRKSKSLKYKIHSDIHNANVSRALKGKSYEELMGKEQADKLKEKQSLQRKCSIEKRKQMSIIMTNLILDGKIKQNTNHLNGYYFSIINKKKFWFRSSYELIAYKILDENIEIKEWTTEPLRIEYKKDDGSTHNTIPDILIEYKSGIKQIINIKPLKRTKERLNVLKSEAIKKYCEENNLKYSIWTENELNLINQKEAKTKALKYLENNKHY